MDDLARARRALQLAIEQRDADALEGLLHDDFALVVTTPALLRLPRASWLALLPDYLVHAWAVEDEQVDVDGDLALVASRVRMTATVSGQERNGPFVVTDLWRRVDRGWALWRRHSTPFEAGALPAERG